MPCSAEYDLAVRAQLDLFETLETAKRELRLLTKEEVEQAETLLMMLSIYVKERT